MQNRFHGLLGFGNVVSDKVETAIANVNRIQRTWSFPNGRGASLIKNRDEKVQVLEEK